MLKAKNIIIIFIINYFLILLACTLLEFIFVGNYAQQAQLLMRTAADMALEQVQATDDFFVTGGGYLLDEVGQDSYKIYVNKGDKFEKVDLFPAFTNNANDKSAVGDIYEDLYGADFRQFLNENPEVLSLRFYAGKYGFTNTGGTFSTITSHYYALPKIYQMGFDILRKDTNWYVTNVKNISGVNYTTMYNDLTVANEGIIDMYELDNSAKIAYDKNLQQTEYYFTPISLGITYINEDLLQALYMNNLDLLMRTKFMKNADYNLTEESYGNGILRGAFYPELTDTDTLDRYNPINNGMFSLLRGERISGTGQGSNFYKGTVPLKVEYVVLDMYKDTPTNNAALQSILGPRFTNDTASADEFGSLYFTDTATASLYQGKEVTGALLYQMDYEYIKNLKTVMGMGFGVDTIVDHKPIVVAKVTFYADFVIPFSTVSLREMRGREVDGGINGRTLFNAFSNSLNPNATYLDGNYVELQIPTKNIGDNRIYPSSYYSDRIVDGNGVINRLNGDIHSDAMTYTTYFAITP